MNAAIEMLRARAAQMYELVLGESNITLEIDPIEAPVLVPTVEPALSNTPALTATAKVHKYSEDSRKMSDNMMRAVNHNDYDFDQMNVLSKLPDGTVWIYNVSDIAYELHGSIYKDLKVPPSKDSEYVEVCSFPEWVKIPRYNGEDDTVHADLIDGRRAAQDLLNPSNYGLDQDKPPHPHSAFSMGCDYNARGLFWSTHNPPLKKELRAAHKRLKKYYSDLIERVQVERATIIATKLNVKKEVLEAAEKYLGDAVGNKITTQETQ